MLVTSSSQQTAPLPLRLALAPAREGKKRKRTRRWKHAGAHVSSALPQCLVQRQYRSGVEGAVGTGGEGMKIAHVNEKKI